MLRVVAVYRLALIALFYVVCGSAQPISLTARDAFNVGVREFQAGQFRSAAASFAKAVERAPNLLNARIYLAAAWVQAYRPDDASAENAEVARFAFEACQEVLKRDPKNVAATDSIATLYFQMREFVRAREWNLKVLSLDPNSKTSLHMLGAIIWSEFSVTLREAREIAGMAPEDAGPLKDAALREELKAKYRKALEDGIEFERAALDLDTGYARAMLTMADLLRVRAELGDEATYAADMAEAAAWGERGARASVPNK